MSYASSMLCMLCLAFGVRYDDSIFTKEFYELQTACCVTSRRHPVKCLYEKGRNCAFSFLNRNKSLFCNTLPLSHRKHNGKMNFEVKLQSCKTIHFCEKM